MRNASAVARPVGVTPRMRCRSPLHAKCADHASPWVVQRNDESSVRINCSLPGRLESIARRAGQTQVIQRCRASRVDRNDMVYLKGGDRQGFRRRQ